MYHLTFYLLWSVITNRAHVCQMHDQSIQIRGGKSMDNKDNCNCDSNFSYISMLYDLCTRRKYPVNAPCWVYLQQKRFAGSFSFFLLHLLDSVVPLSPLLSLLFAFTMDLRIHHKIWNIQAQHSQFLWTQKRLKLDYSVIFWKDSSTYRSLAILCVIFHMVQTLVVLLLSRNVFIIDQFPASFFPSPVRCFSPFLPSHSPILSCSYRSYRNENRFRAHGSRNDITEYEYIILTKIKTKKKKKRKS